VTALQVSFNEVAESATLATVGGDGGLMATADGTTKDSRTASAATTRPRSRRGRTRCARTDLRLVTPLLLLLIYPVA
jgi:hypothetical protein